jgi:hypothetical protein
MDITGILVYSSRCKENGKMVLGDACAEKKW